MTIKVLLADDHKIIREGLRALLEKERGIEVVGEASDGRAIIKMIEKYSPDVVLMDISMPDTNGIEATRKIIEKNPKIKIIALSMHSDRRFVADMLSAGASGYLLKDCAMEELGRAIRTVISDHVYLCPSVAKIVAEGFVQKPGRSGTTIRTILTPRELEVLQLLVEGKATKEIAFHLNVSIKTVETHRKNISEKLDIHTIAELTKYAVREGLTSLES